MAENDTVSLAELAKQHGPNNRALSWFDKLTEEQQAELREFRKQAVELRWSKAFAYHFATNNRDLQTSLSSFKEWWRCEEEAEKKSRRRGR